VGGSAAIVGGRALPWIAAGIVLGALLLVATNGTWWSRAQARLPWMLQPIFHDWHVVRAGLETYAAGADPLAMTGHPYNYPRAVLQASWFGGQYLSPVLAGLGLAAAGLGALAFALGRSGWLTAALAAGLMFSPPVLLLFERGNLDALVLFQVVTGLFLLVRGRQPWIQAGGVLLLLASSLVKLYPAVLLAAGVLYWSGHRRRWHLAALVGFLALALWQQDELALIFRKTGRGVETSYGWAVAGSRLGVDHTIAPEMVGVVLRLSNGISFAVLAVAALIGWRLRTRLGGWSMDPLDRGLFWAGAVLYVATFAIGSNWSYRLVFLLLCLPGLVAAVRGCGWRLWGALGLVLLVGTMLVPFESAPTTFYLIQATEWLLAGWLTVGAVAVLADRQAARY
jgi:hypothetical protein